MMKYSIPYRDLVAGAVALGREDKANELLQEGITEMAEKMSTIIQEVPYADFFLLWVSLTMTARQLEEHMTPSQRSLAHNLLDHTVGVTVVEKEK